jgi:hypothetical protein
LINQLIVTASIKQITWSAIFVVLIVYLVITRPIGEAIVLTTIFADIFLVIILLKQQCEKWRDLHLLKSQENILDRKYLEQRLHMVMQNTNRYRVSCPSSDEFLVITLDTHALLGTAYRIEFIREEFAYASEQHGNIHSRHCTTYLIAPKRAHIYKGTEDAEMDINQQRVTPSSVRYVRLNHLSLEDFTRIEAALNSWMPSGIGI